MAFQSNAFQSNAFQLKQSASVVVVTAVTPSGGIPHDYVPRRTKEDMRRIREDLGILPKAQKIIAKMAKAAAKKEQQPDVNILRQRLERERIAWDALYASQLQMQYEQQMQMILSGLQAQQLMNAFTILQKQADEQEEQAIILLMYEFM